MSSNDGYVAAVVDALGGIGPVNAKRMFGGTGIWADGVMFALVADDVLYLKAGDATTARFEAEGLAPFQFDKAKGQVVITSYRRAPERLLDDPEEMVEWARAALAVAKAAADARPQRRATSRDAATKPTRTAATKPARNATSLRKR